MRLYKLMARRWAEQFVTEGKFRIGTLFDYGDTEKYGDAVGDGNEGYRDTYSGFEGVKRGDELNPFEAQFFKFGSEEVARSVTFVGRPTFVVPHPRQNLYLFSTMMRDSLDAQRRINEENARAGRSEEYDVCVEITNSRAFFKIINGYMAREANANAFASGQCTYADQSIDYNKPAIHAALPPAMVKKLDHAYQNEYRALYIDRQKRNDIQPVYPELIELTPYVRIIR